MNEQVLITILTYRRPNYLAQTLEALERHVYTPEICRGEIFINAEDPKTRSVINRHRHLFEEVFSSPTNLHQAPALNRLWSNTSAEYILHVEDDQVATRGGWLQPALAFLHKYPNIGQLRLSPFWEAPHLARHNLITRKPIEFFPPETIEGEKFSRMREPAHLTFMVSLMKMEAIRQIVPLGIDSVRDQAENEAQQKFHAAGWGTAQIHNSPFLHIGRHSAFGGWGVGFGLHPSTRMGKFRLQLHRKAVKLAKRILGRD